MKLFLSSFRIPDVEVFTEFVGKEASQIKMALVLNAKDHKPKEERDAKRDELLEYYSQLGFQVEELNLLEYADSEKLLEKFKTYDVVWFSGGNTYCLRWACAQSGAEKVLREALEAGVVYGGDSAGAIVVGPTLKYYGAADDPTDAPQVIEEGLGFINLAVLPHWGSVEFGPFLVGIERNLQKDRFNTVRLTNYEYVLVEDNKVVIKGLSAESIIRNLKSQGYQEVYLWEVELGETDTEHAHEFDTKLVILEGEIKIKIEKEVVLQKGDEIVILRGQIHSAVVGPEGCKYIVAEKHYDA